MNNPRGEGLISVMISIAILGILIVTMVTLYQVFGNMMSRSLLRREADGIANRVRGLLMQKTMCTQAFGARTQFWDGQNEQDISLNENGTIYQAGYTFADGRVVINRLFLRKKYIPNPISLPTAPNIPANVRLGKLNFFSYAGEVVFRFGLTSDATNLGALNERVAEVLLVVNPATNAIHSCDINNEASLIGACDEAKAAVDGHACPSTPSHLGCINIPYVKEIDARGEPICHCIESCPVPVWRAQGFTGSCAKFRAVTPPSSACPPGAARTLPYPNKCYGWEGQTCKWKQLGPSCSGRTPYEQWTAYCQIVF